MTLWLTHAQLDALTAQAADTVPAECCGLIGGTVENGSFRAAELVPIPNRAVDPDHHFEMDAAALVTTLFDFELRGLALVGIYHSHPRGAPLPSVEDVKSAYYPGIPYVIIGRRGAETICAAWMITQGDVTPLALNISDSPPPAVLPTTSPAGIVWCSALIAAAFMIALALWLLPPAPVIP
ncbi:MAG: M67 family metallopeptidase [bacterium]|nr:M67 family metallopeptidase [bacterium]